MLTLRVCPCPNACDSRQELLTHPISLSFPRPRGKQVPVIAAGGICDGRHLAMSMALGADAVWVGTRFVASVEGGAPKGHKVRSGRGAHVHRRSSLSWKR